MTDEIKWEDCSDSNIFASERKVAKIGDILYVVEVNSSIPFTQIYCNGLFCADSSYLHRIYEDRQICSISYCTNVVRKHFKDNFSGNYIRELCKT